MLGFYNWSFLKKIVFYLYAEHLKSLRKFHGTGLTITENSMTILYLFSYACCSPCLTDLSSFYSPPQWMS